MLVGRLPSQGISTSANTAAAAATVVVEVAAAAARTLAVPRPSSVWPRQPMMPGVVEFAVEFVAVAVVEFVVVAVQERAVDEG